MGKMTKKEVKIGIAIFGFILLIILYVFIINTVYEGSNWIRFVKSLNSDLFKKGIVPILTAAIAFIGISYSVDNTLKQNEEFKIREQKQVRENIAAERQSYILNNQMKLMTNDYEKLELYFEEYGDSYRQLYVVINELPDIKKILTEAITGPKGLSPKEASQITSQNGKKFTEAFIDFQLKKVKILTLLDCAKDNEVINLMEELENKSMDCRDAAVEGKLIDLPICLNDLQLSFGQVAIKMRLIIIEFKKRIANIS